MDSINHRVLGLLSNVLFFPKWQAPTRPATRKNRSPIDGLGTLLVVAAFSLTLRLWAQSRPRNFDFDSWLLVSENVLNLANPYETGRWPYGPFLLPLLGFMRALAQEPDAFRIALTLFLFFVDVGISLIFLVRGHLKAACLFLVLPTTIAISGQHQQFDSVAVLLALLAASAANQSKALTFRKLNLYDVYALVALTASLASKHVFLLLPIWFAFKQEGLRRRLVYLIGPYAAFAVLMLPFALWSPSAVQEHVLFYRSYGNAPLYAKLNSLNLLPLSDVNNLIFVLFGIIVLLLGLFFRQVDFFSMTLAYGATTLLFSSAVADQYFVIGTPSAAYFLNFGYLLWLLFSGIYFFGNPVFFDVPLFRDLYGYLGGDNWLNAYSDLAILLGGGWVIMAVWMAYKVEPIPKTRGGR